MYLLRVRGLNKSYENHRVLSNFSMNLKAGEIIGLIGANGSGKTTFLKSILGLINLDSGEILVDNVIVNKKDKTYLNNIGAIIEYPTFYENFTAYESLVAFTKLYHKALVLKEIDDLLKLVDLEKEKNSRISSFSLGMKQRLGLAHALIHNPKILLLDEPFNGLDPKGIKELRQLLTSLAQKGVGVIISSHSLEELSKIIDSVVVINEGKVLFQGKKDEYLSRGKSDGYWLLKTDNLRETLSIVDELKIDYQLQDGGLVLDLSIKEAEEKKSLLLAKLLENHISIDSLVEHQENFEDIFLNF